MPKDSYQDYMYEASKKKKELLKEINSLGRQVEGIDVLLKYAELNDRETGILMRKRMKLFDERKALIDAFYKL